MSGNAVAMIGLVLLVGMFLGGGCVMFAVTSILTPRKLTPPQPDLGQQITNAVGVRMHNTELDEPEAPDAGLALGALVGAAAVIVAVVAFVILIVAPFL